MYIVDFAILLLVDCRYLGPWTLGDKEILENVQRSAVTMVTNLSEQSYGERLAEMEMTNLEDRRRRGDLIQVFRVMAGKDRVDLSTWLSLTQTWEGAMATRLTSGCLTAERKQGQKLENLLVSKGC